MKVYRAVLPVRPYLKTMKMNRSSLKNSFVVLVGFALAASSLGQTKVAAETKWEKDPSVAFARAKKEGKKVFIDFYTTWCGPCKNMDKRVFPVMNRYPEWNKLVHLKIDAENPKMVALVKKYKVDAYPTMIIASADRKQISKMVGAMSAPDLKQKLTNLKPRPNKVPKVKRPGG